MTVIATLCKGYDLDYIWKQVDAGLAREGAGYHIQASETGGEPPGRWWGPGAEALGFRPGQVVERKPYDLLFGERKAPDGAQPGAVPGQLALSRAAQQAVALAQQEKSTWTRADLVKYLGRVLPRTGRDPAQAAALLEDLADRALGSEFEPVLCLERPPRQETYTMTLQAAF